MSGVVLPEVRPAGPEDLDLIRTLFTEYATELGVDLCFQGFEEELAQLPGKYAPPSGALLLCGDLGCVAMRNLGSGTVEMKRLFVRPAGRSLGVGQALATAILDAATVAGYDRIVLDTLETLRPALRLYERLGFTPCDPYYPNPLEGVIYLAKPLSRPNP